MMRETLVMALVGVGLGACGSKTAAEPAGTGGVVGTGGVPLGSGGQGSGGATNATGNSGAGGRSATGSAAGLGGATGSGGAANTGGTSGGGGVTGTGGFTSVGGTAGPGGRSSTGGATASGGTAGAGGAAGRGSGGAPATGGASGSTSDAGSLQDAAKNDSLQDRVKDASEDAPVPQGEAGDVKPAQCPATSTLKAGDNRQTLELGGRSRSYVVYLPSSVKAGTAVPLIFDFHGHGGSSTQEESAARGCSSLHPVSPINPDHSAGRDD